MPVNLIIRNPDKSINGKNIAKYMLIFQHYTNEYKNPKQLVAKAVIPKDIF